MFFLTRMGIRLFNNLSNLENDHGGLLDGIFTSIYPGGVKETWR